MNTLTPPVRKEFRVNPGKGWMLMHPSAPPENFAHWPWISCVYYRLNWCDLEPQEGQFAWNHPQWESDFKRWNAAGVPVGLDVMCCNPHGGVYSTPKWVSDSGAKGSFYRRDSGDPQHHGVVMDRWEPDYDDPIFQRKLENFLSAMAQRYDADPMVDFVTLRSYAAWGEWWGSEARHETLNWMVDIHCRLFKRTPLLIPVGMERRWEPVTKPAIQRGLGVRKDGLGGPVHPGETELFDLAYNRAPNMLEFWGPRSYLINKGWDQLFDKEECIYRWHASRVNMGYVGQAKEWVEHEPDFLDRCAKKLGYEFSIKQATFTDRLKPGERLTFDAWWRNDGVAPYVRNGSFYLLLRNGQGREVEIHRDPALPNQIRPVAHFASKYEILLPPQVKSGEWTLLAGMQDHFKDRTTPIRLAHEDDELGRVVLGIVTVQS